MEVIVHPLLYMQSQRFVVHVHSVFCPLRDSEGFLRQPRSLSVPAAVRLGLSVVGMVEVVVVVVVRVVVVMVVVRLFLWYTPAQGLPLRNRHVDLRRFREYIVHRMAFLPQHRIVIAHQAASSGQVACMVEK